MNKRRKLLQKKIYSLSAFVILVALFTLLFAGITYGYKEPVYKTITVKSGDSLWSIASQYNKKGDIREYIYDLKKLNDLTSSEILIGSKLKVAVE